jgi:hypothetical protein
VGSINIISNLAARPLVELCIASMNLEHINNIEDLIPLGETKKIVDRKIKRLTAVGENYGSLMLSVDLIIKTPIGNEEIHAVAKTVPPNEYIQKIFNTPVTFRNEIAFYKNIVPLLQEFQREHGVKEVIDFVPKYYGSRLNLKCDEGEVDKDAVLLLENLKVANYSTLERREGFDLDAAKLIITDLAQFHAVPLALKLKKPDVFEKEIKPYMASLSEPEEGRQTMRAQIEKLIDDVEELKPLKERILKKFNNTFTPQEEVREPFAIIVHNDCWVNNFLVKLERSKPVKSMMVDYQVMSYGSPAKDIVFFLFSSVKDHVVKEHYDDLIQLYYKTFTSVLEQLKCDTTPFTFKALQEEIDHEARNSQFAHVSFMLYPIFAPVPEEQDFTKIDITTIMGHTISDAHKQKYTFVVKEFIKRNWL